MMAPALKLAAVVTNVTYGGTGSIDVDVLRQAVAASNAIIHIAQYKPRYGILNTRQ
jgi:hypothetical protein